MDEQSASGQPIHRHSEAAEPTWSGGDPELIGAVTDHIGRHLGEVTRVWHPHVAPHVHVDVHAVEPSEERPFHTLVTSGMSERPMPAPEGAEDLRHAELVLALPADWPLDDDRGFWPIGILRELAELPHAYDTWLWAGHTVPNGEPPAPYTRGTRLCGALLASPLLVPEAFDVLRLGDREIHFLGVVLLHADEMQLKLDEGVEALIPLLERAQVTEGVVPDRPSVVAGRRRRWFGRR